MKNIDQILLLSGLPPVFTIAKGIKKSVKWLLKDN